jgi:hypothetical protein
MRTKLIRLVIGAAIAAGIVPLLAGDASGHQMTGTTISCAGVSGHFTDFGSADHPIVWHVDVAGSGFQAVATSETPDNFVGSGTASADISAMTSGLHGTSATVQAFATWPGGQSATTSAMVTCGVPLVSPVTSPPQVGGIQATAPGSAGVSTLVVPAAPVPAAATFTG